MAVFGHLLAGDEGSDGDAVLLAHHTLGRRLVHLGGAGLGLRGSFVSANIYVLFKEMTRADIAIYTVLDKLTVRPQVS